MTLTENSAALASPFPSSFETRTLYKRHMLIYQLKRNWITMSVIKQERRVIPRSSKEAKKNHKFPSNDIEAATMSVQFRTFLVYQNLVRNLKWESMWPYQMENADIATVASCKYPANKIRTALYQNSKLLRKWRKSKEKRKGMIITVW